uniref:30S ribosomal protein S4 n=1 Tax=Nephromyces sp. ex Molgula occidentalis TaxID=2544991 RepID=A0A5C1H8H0_9APIC|nr:30S ribosomal protein S4 [Nephromyces sp. ex Molgula occidentalis]
MVRYLGPKVKRLKNIGISFLPGFSSHKIKKTDISNSLKKKTNYFYCLKEKQKLRFKYSLTNKKLEQYILNNKKKPGIITLNLIKLLEMRLDSILFRTGFCKSLNQAKQFISHKHVFINKTLVYSSNIILKVNDIIYINPNSSVCKIITNNLKTVPIIDFLNIQNLQYQVCIKTFKIKILRQILSSDISFYINQSLFLENF